MTDQVLSALRIVFLALVYLFFGRVLWAVWNEVRFPASRQASGSITTGLFGGTKSRPDKGKLIAVIVEPRQRRGESHSLSSVLSIGRDGDNDIASPDDSFMSGTHARLEVRPSGAWLVDLESTNGTFVNGQRVEGDRSVRKGDRIQVGSTVLEVRS